MISVYAPLASSTSGAGEAVLCPTSATIRSVAGGEYSFSMKHPMDPWNKWRFIKREAIIRLPVPMEVIENAYTGQEADIYVTLDSCEMKDGTVEPSEYTFPYWSASSVYAVGDKVRDPGYGAYKCTYFDATSGYTQVPPHNSPWWTKVANGTSGSATIVTLKGGTELYLVEEVDATWLKLMTMYGVTGYLKRSQVRFDRHVDPEQVQPRIITEQLFRVKDVAIDHKAHEVSVSGVHVSNDLSGNMIENVELNQANLPMALTRIMDGLMLDYPGEVATDMVNSDLTYTGSFKGKNGLFAFLDPDSGIVKRFGAKFTRDNWDLFIMQNTSRNTGFRMSYGNNTNGINWRTKSDKLVTRIMPVAKDAGGADYYLPAKYVDASNIDQFPVVYMETLRVDAQIGKPKSDDPNASNWTENEVKAEMTAKANERFTVDHVNEPQTEITVQLEMLGATAEYPWLKDLQSVLLYDTVLVSDESIGLDQTMTVTEIEYDCIKEKISGIKLSNAITSVARTVTGYNVSNASIGAEKLKDGVADGIIRAAVAMMPDFSDPTASRPATVSVTDGDPTLSWGTRSTVGSVQGTALHVTMPSNPAPTVVDNLDSTSATAALSANQGKVLNGKIGECLKVLDIGVIASGGTKTIAITKVGTYLVSMARYNAASLWTIYGSGSNVFALNMFGSGNQSITVNGTNITLSPVSGNCRYCVMIMNEA